MLSFVVPAYNEAPYIGRCVDAIKRFTPADEPFEIIVIDNRSTDGTAGIAERAGARVLASSARTIGAVRNEGVRASRGDILVLLDGDCLLTEAWARGIGAVLREVRDTPLLLAGSHPVPPSEERVFLWRHWFRPFFQQDSSSHIGSAHMICRRETFDRIGGFDEQLVTGEDFDLCARLRAAGGRVHAKLPLLVEHHGFPRTLGAFIRRERWHGRGDVSSVRAFVSSRVALLGAAFTLLLAGALVTLLLGWFVMAGALAASALAILIASSVVRFRHVGPVGFAIATGLFGVYFTARTLALVDAARRAR